MYPHFFFLMIRRPPRSTLDRSSAASDVYKRQDFNGDGKTDLSYTAGAAEWMAFSRGDGTMTKSTLYTSSFCSSGYNVTGIGDFNGDGQTDLRCSGNAGHPLGGFHTFATVSYTHLRAHETPE